MLHRKDQRPLRSGVAAVEMAVVLVPMFILLVGTLEVGRMIHVTQILSNAARDAGRMASQGQVVFFDPSAGGFRYSQVYTYPQALTPPPLNLADRVREYLNNNGINATGVPNTDLVTYVNNGQASPPPLPDPPPNPLPDPTQPWGAVKGDRLSVTVRIPYSRVRWTPMTLMNPNLLSATTDFYCNQDNFFQVISVPPDWRGY